MKNCLSLLVLISVFLARPLLSECCCHRVELRAADFIHSNHLFREIYAEGGVDYQLQAATQVSSFLEGWCNLSWYSKHGKSVGFGDPTKISLLNCSIGVNFLYQYSSSLTLYLGLGPSLTRMWLRNKSSFNDHEISKAVLGIATKSGIYWRITACLYADFFIDYLYQPVHFKHRSHLIDLGGVKPGVGLGVIF